MNEADGVNLQKFRLMQIKTVAQSLDGLRETRAKAKKRYEESYARLHDLNAQIAVYKEAFDKM